ncbi:MAG: terminase family protein [Pseudomonadota bacterium]|nr:terminase family protein [Pseudomonadota bacterium]
MTSPPTDIPSTTLTPSMLDSLSYAEKLEMVALLEKREKILGQNKLYGYKPYPKQLEFHNAGATYRERMFLAGNQLGKTLSAGHEAAYHATGLYPDWWQGRRIDHANKGWVGAPSGEFVRDNAQRILFGEMMELGTGTIPKELIIGRPMMAHGTTGLIDMIRIRHVSGGTSVIKFKTYDQGREKWQGTPVDWIWPDEEPPIDIYTEALTRTNATKGFIFCTLTPLLGMSDTVMRFMGDSKSPDTHLTIMGIDDAAHISPERRATIIASYQPHEREARINGTPMLGSGRIFPIAEEEIRVDPIPIPKHWPQIGGMDFGYDHPFAAVRLAWDRDNDCIYVTAEYRVAEKTPVYHVGALRPWGNLKIPDVL